MRTQVLSSSLVALLLLAGQWSCGGAHAGDNSSGTPGQSHNGSGDEGGNSDSVDDGDIDSPLHTSEAAADAGATAPTAPVTFVLRNTGKETLFLNMDKGWQAVIYAYSGTPPNAKSILMFPTHCTASCSSAPEEICPVCEEPQHLKEIKAAENHDAVEPGDSREVPWDGEVFSYKKARGTHDGKRARCNCFEMVEPPPEEYTIKACGLRKTKSAKTRSQYQCVTASLTLPITEPVRVELDFGK